tara:strand:- start:1185 stop:3185 length:2001 start_codon:yes stop_codon:yes gene_type:complete
MATKDYDAMIRKAIQSGNYAVDTPKSVLQEMFPDLAQWRLDRLGMENLSEDTQNYINSPFSTIKDTAYTNPFIGNFLGATLNYTGADTTVIDSVIKAVDKFEAGSISEENNNPGNIQYTKRIKDLYGDKVTKGKSYIDAEGKTRYHARFADLDTGKVAQREVVEKNWKESGGDPVKFTQKYTGSPDKEVIKNYSNEIKKNIESIPVDQDSNSIMKRTNELGTEALDKTVFSPNTQPIVSPAIKKAMVDNTQPIVSPTLSELMNPNNVSASSVPTATDLAKNFNKEEEMMLAGAESLGWKELGSLSPISTNPIGPRTDNLDMDGDGALDYFKGDFNRYSDPIVNNIPSTANVSTGNKSLQGPPVDTGLGRDGGVNPYRTPKNEMLSSIQSVPTGTTNSLIDPDMVSQNVNNSQGMSFEEFMTPPDINIMDSQYDPQFGSGGGTFTDVTANQFTGTGQNPVLASSSSAPATSTSLNFDFGNALQGGIMVGTNLASLGKYDEAIGDMESAIDELGVMSGTAIEDANRKGAELRDIMMSGVESQADSVNQKLQTSMAKLRNNPKNVVGNLRNTSNEVRKTLQTSLDSTMDLAESKLDAQLSTLADNRRDTIAYIDSMKEQQASAIKDLEKEKEEAKWGAAVGVGSILADTVLPGSGQALRTGWNMYSSRT